MEKGKSLEVLIQREIDRLDAKIDQLQEIKKAWQTSLFHARNREDKEETNVSIPVKIISVSEHLNSMPHKPSDALIKLFNEAPLTKWTTLALTKELRKMKTEGKLDSTGKNLLWIVHNGLRILDKRTPKPVLKIGEGRNAYYIKNPNA